MGHFNDYTITTTGRTRTYMMFGRNKKDNYNMYIHLTSPASRIYLCNLIIPSEVYLFGLSMDVVQMIPCSNVRHYGGRLFISYYS